MNKLTAAVIISAFIIAFTSCAKDSQSVSETKSAAQVTCPVMGGPINRDIFIDHAGERVYFCCPPCLAEFKKNPDKYLNDMKAKGIVPEKTPAGK